MLENGKILQNRYRIETIMERRKQVVLYKAYDEMLLQDVIIKEYFPENIKCRENLMNEEKELFVKTAERFFGRFDWSGILQIKDRFEENETIYLVFEYISKKTIKEYLRGIPQKQFDWKIVLQMLMPMIKTMSLMHAEGMTVGKVSVEDLWVREDGTCCLISIGENVISKEDAEVQGPWSDVYEICGILLEVLKGREVDTQIRYAILQGRNAEIQQRYFYFGILLERLLKAENAVARSELEEVQKLREKIQDVWGEKWLKITTSSEQKKERKKHKKFRMTKTKIRKLIIAAVLIIGIIGVFTVFLTWKEKQPKTTQEILEALQQIEPAEADDEKKVYNVSKEFVQEYDLVSNCENAFAVKREEVVSWMQKYYGIEFLKANSTEWFSYVSVYEDASREMFVQNYETMDYACSVQGKQLKVSVKYDVADDSVYSVTIHADRKICEEMMIEFLPVIVPEACLTEEETETFFTYAAEEGYIYDKHGKYELYLRQSVYSDWILEFYNYPKFEETDTDMVRAGNYARTSEKYQEFTEFLENKAVSMEDVTDGRCYTLDEAAVEEWGEACNAYLFDVSADEVRTVLTDTYRAELVKEDTILEATVYEGGAINTFFVKRERYNCENTIRIILVSDYISGKVNRLYVLDDENDAERAAHYMKEVLSLVSDDLNDDAENDLKEMLQQYRANVTEDSSYQMYSCLKDCTMFFVQVDNKEGICIKRVLSEGYDCAPYNWP